MPNTLAHFGIQGAITHTLLQRAETKWILLGCLIPDIPWILQRAVWTLLPTLNRYDVKLYVIVQASLAVSLLLCASLALVARHPRKVFGILALNSLLHLLLDACEIKWGNGVHLFAPLSWKLLMFGWFWPDSAPTVVLTVGGLLYVIWAWRSASLETYPAGAVPRWRYAPAACCLLAYMLVPLGLLNGPYEQDNHFLQTLRDQSHRAGRQVEFDRERYLHRASEDRLQTFTGEELQVTGKRLDRSSRVSVRAVFIDDHTIHIDVLHEHRPGARDGASYLGIGLLIVFWIRSWPPVKLLMRRVRLR